MTQNPNIKDVTNSPEDWDDFWNEEDFTDDEIEYLKTRSKYYFDYNRNDLNRPNPFKKIMALSQSVEQSLKEAEQSLRNALAYAARQERPMVCSVIADLISKIESIQETDSILDKLENRKPGDSGMFGNLFDS